jgi:hypothetical protein
MPGSGTLLGLFFALSLGGVALACAAYVLVAVLAALVVGQGGDILSRLMTGLGIPPGRATPRLRPAAEPR